ncbi:MAG: histidine kinase [Myxococcota bacterium]|nr:histidine kinase [Myxococcota bacterium]
MATLLTQFLLLLEKMAVIVAAAFLLSAARPFQTLVLGRRSWLRGLLIVVLFAGISIWGSHLGLEIMGFQANNRAVGILVAGLLGGPWVGTIVGLLGGSYFVFIRPPAEGLAPILVLVSTLDGLLAGLWAARRRASGTAPWLAFLVALGVQGIHLLVAGGLVILLDHPLVHQPFASHLGLLPELLENSFAVGLFVGIVRTALRLREAEIALSRQQAAAAQARLQALQAQIRPHFLFNALTTISYLVRTDPEQARALLGKLAALYRHLLRTADLPVPLGEEVEQVRRYLEIERARFGERLRVDFAIAPEVQQARVPSLLLQPLVENAVKHGISPRPQGGQIWVTARQEGSWLVLEVADDGVGYDGSRPGTGLTNVAQRVAALGPAAESFTVQGGPGQGTRVCLRLPLLIAPAGAPASAAPAPEVAGPPPADGG